jgi:NADH-quinone oxidoreductase subunit G
MRDGLDSADLDSRQGEPVPLELARALAAPSLQASVPDLEFAHTVLVLGCEPLDDAPILDLRIRKGVRRRGVQLAIATARPSALDPNARLSVRYPPGEDAAFLADLESALGDGPQDAGEEMAALAKLLSEGGEDVVIVWGERLPADALPALLRIADRLALAGREGAGLLEIPAGANGRGLREAGVLPNAGPGYAEPTAAGRGAQEIAAAAAAGELSALYLFQTDPIRDLPDRAAWDAAMHHVGLVVAHASVLTDGLRLHADVILPADSHAEKDGTVVHPDGRLQRLRTAIAHPGQVRSGWQVLNEIAERVGYDLGVLTSPTAFEQLAAAVPFYEGLTLEEIGGRGVRWPERDAASAMPSVATGLPANPRSSGVRVLDEGPAANGTLRLGTYRPIWAAPEVEASPALHFTIAHQQIELSPEDAQRLGIHHGATVSVAQNGTRLSATAAVRTGVPPGTAFLADGIATDSANALTEPMVKVSSQ